MKLLKGLQLRGLVQLQKDKLKNANTPEAAWEIVKVPRKVNLSDVTILTSLSHFFQRFSEQIWSFFFPTFGVSRLVLTRCIARN